MLFRSHPSPQQMRDSMDNSGQYQRDLFTWLESLIKCELLGTTMIVEEPEGPLPRPRHREVDGYVHPGTILGPRVDDIDPDAFSTRFASSVNDVVTRCNWHEHTETCWKYLRRGEKRTDENCRMRIDGHTREVTAIDPESGSILLRRLHPRIASYNDLIIFLLRANMDIKHIGSGEAAKALIYYVTDYITKTSLPAHVGLSALLYAIHRTNDKYKHVPDVESVVPSGALTILVNGMMARQEVSHQQVMSYLVGGGDNYSSHKYRILHYGTFERFVLRFWTGLEIPSERADDNDSVQSEQMPVSDEASASTSSDAQPVSSGIPQILEMTGQYADALADRDESVTLLLGSGSISAVNQQQDYFFRPLNEPFASMGLYEFVGMTEKTSKHRDSIRINRRQQPTSGHRGVGRPEEERGEFLPEHPQHETHVVRKRTVWTVPVILGNRIPRSDRDDEEREHWARAVLTLFTPWRHPSNLKEPNESWTEAYERHKETISPEHTVIIANMNVLNECRDARDKSSISRRAPTIVSIQIPPRPPSPDPFDVYVLPQPGTDPLLTETADPGDPNMGQNTLIRCLDHSIGVRFRHAIDSCFSRPSGVTEHAQVTGTAAPLTDSVRDRLMITQSTMRKLKRKRRPSRGEAVHDGSDRRVRARLSQPPILDAMELDDRSTYAGPSHEAFSLGDPEDLIRQVVIEMNLQRNSEQLRAFEIVGTHVIRGGPQLLMYIGGVGGTGKSHVLKSILRLFDLIGKTSAVLIGAPTGAAAILIGGHTIHSLTMLPDVPGRDLQDLVDTWEGVDYFIIDEVSMIGAYFLSQLNARLTRAKGGEECWNEKPFGGINMIFTGDFGQLRPILDASLYSHNLVHSPGIESCRGKTTICALMGVYLWRQVTTVVLLKINQRQADDAAYANILERVRTGEATKSRDVSGAPSDLELLKSRYMDRLTFSTKATLPNFEHAPIIVGRKKIHDILNLRIMGHHANSTGVTVHLYHSRDRIAGQLVTGDEMTQLWKLSSTTTHDSLGKLPLFPGMKVMVQENLAFGHKVVNGTEGTVQNIIYEEDGGRRFAAVVYIHVPGAGKICADATNDIIPIFPEWTSFYWYRANGHRVSVSRTQLPLLPSYAYTDYKSQGRSLAEAIVDPESASSLQGVYVMLSRVRSLTGLAVLRPFRVSKVIQRLSQELRTELRRLEYLDHQTQLSHTSIFRDT